MAGLFSKLLWRAQPRFHLEEQGSFTPKTPSLQRQRNKHPTTQEEPSAHTKFKCTSKKKTPSTCKCFWDVWIWNTSNQLTGDTLNCVPSYLLLIIPWPKVKWTWQLISLGHEPQLIAVRTAAMAWSPRKSSDLPCSPENKLSGYIQDTSYQFSQYSFWAPIAAARLSSSWLSSQCLLTDFVHKEVGKALVGKALGTSVTQKWHKTGAETRRHMDNQGHW